MAKVHYTTGQKTLADIQWNGKNAAQKSEALRQVVMALVRLIGKR